MASNGRDSRCMAGAFSAALGIHNNNNNSSNNNNNNNNHLLHHGPIETNIGNSIFYGPGKFDQRLLVNPREQGFSDGNSLTAECLRNQSVLGILTANNNRFDSGREVSSLSGTSTDSQTTGSNRTGNMVGFESPSSHNFHTWSENSPQRETSTGEASKDEQQAKLDNEFRGTLVASGSSDQDHTKTVDSKVLRRLAQNREAARKSRLRKKAYIQQLETSRVKLNQMEQELERARQQGSYGGGASGGDHKHPGVAAFDMDYARWVEEQNRQATELRSALGAHVPDNELRVLVENALAHYDELFRLKGVAVKADVFHIVSGMWKTPSERCFMWMGGFRPSELLKTVLPLLEPLTEQQRVAVCNLQQSSQQGEEALSQGMESLQQNLAETLSSESLGTPNVTNYMGQMAMAMGKLGTLENFVQQADHLRHQTLQRMHHILTTRQAARGLLALGDYFSRLRALSSLWIARPRE